MANVAGRKKSIISSTGLQIDTPVANNTLLNQAAITSLYQECVRLRTRLMRIRGFPRYFNLVSSSDSRQSSDPVTQLWDLFSFGIPLCYIFDQLPEGYPKINNADFKEEQFDTNPDRAKKHAIALFAMQIRTDQVTKSIPGCEAFTVTDLWDRNSTDGLVKVIKTVTALVNYLPESSFDDPPPSPYMSSHDSHDSLATDLAPVVPPASAQESARNNIIREMVETERKYVQDLEIMQKYAAALSQSNLIDQDTIHLLFPNLKQLLNFQRKFLIRFESTAELPWPEQRWGQHFLESEEEFIVYEPYCANYTNASDLMMANESNLSALNNLINVKGELPAFLIKPIQRVCKYPLLLDSLIKAANPQTYPHYEDLKAGSGAAKRITDKINEAQRHAENELTVKNLQNRVDDWKGHHLENFGQLLLDDIFIVTKSDIDREYHVFLFEKIILCCKEAVPQSANGKKMSKSNSILKKQSNPSPLPGGVGQPQKKNTPLLLKGRIFLGNVTQAVPSSPRNSTGGMPVQYPLAVWWKGDDDLEYFTLRCRREDQMRQWETVINRLIRDLAQKRASERPLAKLTNSTNPSLRNFSGYPPQTPTMSPYPGQQPNGRNRGESIYDQNGFGGGYGTGPQGYPPHDGFEFENDDEEYEDYPAMSAFPAPPASGRGTPTTARRGTAASLPPEREPQPAPYDRPRAHTESTEHMQQWRGPPGAAPPAGAMRPITPRMASTLSSMSASSYASDGSFGPGTRQRPPLKSQFSSTRLRSTYTESTDYRNGIPKTPAPIATQAPLVTNRSRSASQPSAYVPKQNAPPPPVPTTHWNHSQSSTSISSMTHKRGSGSSQSTASSDYSPNSSSPITPYGSSESSLGGPGLRGSRSQTFDAVNGAGHAPFPHPVKVKVHFHEDIFVIQVPRATEYDDLVEKVGRKIRLCGPRRDDGPLRVKYKDEDGDMVSLGSTEDVQMAFEQYRPGSQVTLFVT
uniref:Guanine-nucleotide exchange factor Cdc24 n=1 Tax=Flammulina velutipes TaxID=38945 RepID=A0A6C0N6H6_FLAVE|nr:guanine-nucleotide exchange factor Cdc24 [Flammulina velutipes]